jgi:hypothetical protein
LLGEKSRGEKKQNATAEKIDATANIVTVWLLEANADKTATA